MECEAAGGIDFLRAEHLTEAAVCPLGIFGEGGPEGGLRLYHL